MAQTAVEQLVNYMKENFHLTDEALQKFEQAKQMERGQHDITFTAGYDYRSSKEKDIIEAFGVNSKPTFEQYYTQTYSNNQKKLTQKELEARALIAGDLLREGIVTRVETFRVEMDAAIGENTGELKFQKNTDFEDGTM